MINFNFSYPEKIQWLISQRQFCCARSPCITVEMHYFWHRAETKLKIWNWCLSYLQKKKIPMLEKLKPTFIKICSAKTACFCKKLFLLAAFWDEIQKFHFGDTVHSLHCTVWGDVSHCALICDGTTYWTQEIKKNYLKNWSFSVHTLILLALFPVHII